MSVIEADGTTTQRIDGIDILNIAPAQRYSVIVTANQSTDASSTAGVGGGQGFWIRSHLNTKSWPQELLLKPQVLGVFNYIEDDGVGGENSTTTTTSDPSSTPPSSSTLPLLIPTSTPNPSATRLLDIYSLFPLTNTSTSSPSLNQPPPFPTTPNLSLDLNFQFTSTASTNITRAFVSIDGFPDGSSIISSSYYPPKIPTLFSVVDGDLDGIPGSSNVVYLEQGDVVDVTVYNPETEEHVKMEGNRLGDMGT